MSFSQLKTLLTTIHDYQAIAELLSWDQQTLMPPKGDAARARQAALAATEAHRLITSKELGDLLEKAQTEALDPDQRLVVAKAARDRNRAARMPADLVERLVSVTSRAHHIWIEARQSNDFESFAPVLDEIIGLKREQAEALGWPDSGEPYDALLDEYEEQTTCRDIAPVIDDVAQEASRALSAIQDSRKKPDRSLLERQYPETGQEQFCRMVLDAMGFDFQAGRLDRSAHPFTTSFDPGDVRLTTRYNERFLPTAVFGTIHEGGHGLYEQGLDKNWVGTALAEAVSLGLHESQSRLWENQIGRSLSFWTHFYPKLKALFPDSLGDVPLDAFYRAINSVQPSLIRVEADEVSYNLHIALRFRLERALVSGDLQVGDLPGAWNEASKRLFGIEPKSHVEGVLQDVHWSMGLIGYFPTYLLGNLYAAQIAEALRHDIPDMDDQIAQGRFSAIVAWLRSKIHSAGRRWAPGELIERATGRPPSAKPFSRYLRDKYASLYDVDW